MERNGWSGDALNFRKYLFIWLLTMLFIENDIIFGIADNWGSEDQDLARDS